MTKSLTKKEILESALEARKEEVMNYQINIDNYTLALKIISDMSNNEQTELVEFSDLLKKLLNSEKLEQKKANVMLKVLEQQIEQI